MPDFYSMCRNSSTQHGSLSISPRTVSFLSSKVHPPPPFWTSFSSGFPFPFLLTSHFLTFLPFISSHHSFFPFYLPSYTSQFSTCFPFTASVISKRHKGFSIFLSLSWSFPELLHFRINIGTALLSKKKKKKKIKKFFRLNSNFELFNTSNNVLLKATNLYFLNKWWIPLKTPLQNAGAGSISPE